ncbi:MFS transporter [Paenibacillus soyae]|uniref:MFS transporter n=1 Tax=Paenibacillus soyae TaxID=2969249 RepID=A0A9X2MUV5_9BACL|nr:MFS transporter [Paenibacillus soyae]MCR2806985.1 MFS transporter [Paenibacillus soyae]
MNAHQAAVDRHKTLASDTSSAALPREGLLIGLLGLAVVLMIMNTAMFNLALPDVTSAFGITPSAASWIVTGYSIVFAIASITYSRLSDFVPIRRLFVIGLLLLGTAAIAGFFSTSFLMLLLARIAQATGAGGIISLSIVLLSRYIPVSRRGKAMATIMSAVSLGLGLGPVAGGAIVEYFGWPYLFAVTAASLLLIPLFLKLLPEERPSRGSFDLWGALLLSLGTTGILLFLTSYSLLALAAGMLGILLFIVRIRSAKEPFVQPSLFRNGRYMALAAIGIASYMCSFATLFLMPQVLVHRFEMTASHAGFVIFPGSLLAMLASRKIGAAIDRYGNTVLLRYAPPFILVSTLLFGLLIGRSWLAILLIYMLMSLSFTIVSSSVSNEMSRILPDQQIGSGMGLFQLLQFFSGAFSVALAASALEWQHSLPLSASYSNIYWGLAVIALLAVSSTIIYRRTPERLP